MNEVIDLVGLGWNSTLDEAFTEHRDQGYEPARVTVQHRGSYNLISQKGEMSASTSGSLLHRAREAATSPQWATGSQSRASRGAAELSMP